MDGSNIATEGRTDPSLAQLDLAVRSFLDEHPGAEVIVVADATFAHRVTPAERRRFEESELAGEIVTPPAGAIGRGDAFILRIADRINGVVLSNDSFQEFQADYPWLFDEGRVIGGKPVAGVGWVFTPRIPVRGAKTPRAVKKLAVVLAGGAAPTIGTTLTPLKRTASKPAKAPAKSPAKAPAKATPAKASAAKPAATKSPSAKPAPAKRAAKSPTATAKRPAPAAKPVKAPAKKSARAAAPAPAAGASTRALRRDRQPVNPEAEFALFRSAHRVGSRVEGEVTTFTSHGAVITVALKSGGHVECYAPTTMLGDPAPARARDVLARGDRRTFKLVTVDAERRIAELALL
ncbi:MAG: NYN domain-containing protein [Acidimicrobiales bacterium]